MCKTCVAWLLLLSAAWTTGCTEAPPAPDVATWNSAEAQSVRLGVEALMNEFAALNQEGFKAGLTADVVAYEIDMEGKPLRLGSGEEVSRWVEGTMAELKGMGAALKLDIHQTDCRATATVAYCVVDFDLQATMPNGDTMAQPTRNTIVLRKAADGWKWTHWHSSPATAPVPPESLESATPAPPAS